MKENNKNKLSNTLRDTSFKPNKFSPPQVKKTLNETNIENLKTILKNKFNLSEIQKLCENGNGVCEIDLYITKSFLEYFDIKTIVEFGAGTSTKFLMSIGIDVHSFAKEPIHKNVPFTKITIDKYNVSEVKKLSPNNVSCYFVDCDHEYEFIKLLDENIFKSGDFIVEHDYFNTSFEDGKLGRYIRTEQVYVDEQIDSKKWRRLIFTDLYKENGDTFKEISGADIEQFRELRNEYGRTRPPVCLVICQKV